MDRHTGKLACMGGWTSGDATEMSMQPDRAECELQFSIKPSLLHVLIKAIIFGASATIDIDLRKCCLVITDGDDSGAGKKPNPSSQQL